MFSFGFIGWTSFCLIIVLFFWIIYKFIIKPKKQLKNYISEIQKNKWKVLDLGFLPFDTKIRSLTFDAAKIYDDCHY